MPRTCVLLVDSDPAVRAALGFALEAEGFDVDAYDSGGALLRDAATARAGCLVFEYRLPDIDGLSLLAQLRARGITAPAIMMASNPGAVLYRECRDAGVIMVEKPLLSNALTRAIRSAASNRTEAA